MEDMIPIAPTHIQLNHLRFFTSEEVAEHGRVFDRLLGYPNDEPAGYQAELDEVSIDVQVLRDQLREVKERQWPFPSLDQSLARFVRTGRLLLDILVPANRSANLPRGMDLCLRRPLRRGLPLPEAQLRQPGGAVVPIHLERSHLAQIPP